MQKKLMNEVEPCIRYVYMDCNYNLRMHGSMYRNWYPVCQRKLQGFAPARKKYDPCT